MQYTDILEGPVYPCKLGELQQILTNHGLAPREARELIFSLLASGALELTVEDPEFDYSQVRLNSDILHAQALSVEKAPLKRTQVAKGGGEQREARVTLTATLPHNIAVAAEPGLPALRDTIKRLIDESERELFICSPYLDRHGVQYLGESLRAASGKWLISDC